MSAPITNDQFSFSLGNLSYIGASYDEAPAPVVKLGGAGLIAWFRGLVAKATDWQRRRAAIEELGLMTDRELSDIGLTRTDLARVFNTTFASDRARGQNYVPY